MTTPQIVSIPNPAPDPKCHGPPTIIYGGLMRMGSLSIAHAFAILGLRAHHALETEWSDWTILERAANANWPEQGADIQPFSRRDWDQLFGSYDCITDIGSFFAPQLIATYKGAKVVLVQRDFDSWWSSIRQEVVIPVLDHSPAQQMVFNILETLAGVAPVTAMRKILFGFFSAKSLPEVEARARESYDAHYASIRKIVPPELLLEYRLGDGWDPLCDFLGKGLPNVPFPRLNDPTEHTARKTARAKKLLPIIWVRIRPWLLGGTGLVAVLLALAFRM